MENEAEYSALLDTAAITFCPMHDAAEETLKVLNKIITELSPPKEAKNGTQ